MKDSKAKDWSGLGFAVTRDLRDTVHGRYCAFYKRMAAKLREITAQLQQLKNLRFGHALFCTPATLSGRTLSENGGISGHKPTCGD